MGITCLNLLSSSVFILTVVTATVIEVRTNRDHGDCTSASPTDRLAVNVTEPKAYEVELLLRPNYNQFFAICNILIQVHQQTRTISLHAYKIRIFLHEIKLTPVNTTIIIKPVEYRYCNISQILELRFKENIVPAHYHLKLSLVARIKGEFTSLERYGYRTSKKSRRWLVTNLFQPNAARRMFPCWDQPEIKASFNISIIHPRAYRVLSNMPILTVLYKDKYLKSTYFAVSPLISPSEVAIVMFDDTLSQIKTHKMRDEQEIKITWICPRKKIKLHFFYHVINIVKFSLFRNVFDNIIIPETNYILFPKSPMKATGFAQFTIYRDEDVAYDSKLHFSGRKLDILKLLARQEVLQWFDRAVVSSSLSYMLRESFAMYFSHYYTILHYYSSHLHLEDLFTVQILQPTFYYDIALRMKPIIHEVNETDAIDKFLYSRLNGYKGSIILRMLENILTLKDFHQRILWYARKLKHHPDEHNEFWDVLQELNNMDENQIYNISDIMNNWLRQEKFPELFVTYDNKAVYIKAVCDNGAKWNISTNIFIVTNLNYHYVLDAWVPCDDIITIQFPDINFVIVNLHQFGYYRVNYDEIGWTKISSYLQYENYEDISIQNRAQLIDDAYYYVMNDKLSSSTFFYLISYLDRETHYVPWCAMFNILMYLSPYLELPKSTNIKLAIVVSLDNLLKNITYEERTEDDEMTNSLRLLAARWACKFGLQKCTEVAASMLLRELYPPIKKISPWWKDWVYCMGMKGIKKTTWLALFSHFFVTKNADIFKYLVCTDDDALLVFYMDTVLYDERIINLIQVEELVELYRFILKRHLGKSAVFKYVLDHFELIAKRIYGIGNLTTLWGDIILNLPETQVGKIRKFSRNVGMELAPQKSVFKTLLDTRLLYIQNLIHKFHHL